MLREAGTPCLVHQPSYSLLNRWIERGLLEVTEAEGMGVVVFSPLGQGMLTSRYLDGIPSDSRAAEGSTLASEYLSDENLDRVRGLDAIARKRGQTLAQMAIAWTLRDPRVTTALVGASRWSQIEDSLGALDNLEFTPEELTEIERYAVDSGINLWEASSRED
jgi:L-glyceraldehyde 3-phosphate reductase